MLRPLPTGLFVKASERLRYADESMALTVWWGDERQFLAFELVFDLTLDEYAVRRLASGSPSYLRVSEGEARPGRSGKQTLVSADKPHLPRQRLEDFDARSADLPEDLRNYVRTSLLELLDPDETKVDG